MTVKLERSLTAWKMVTWPLLQNWTPNPVKKSVSPHARPSSRATAVNFGIPSTLIVSDKNIRHVGQQSPVKSHTIPINSNRAGVDKEHVKELQPVFDIELFEALTHDKVLLDEIII
jgi:hypothetical protein